MKTRTAKLKQSTVQPANSHVRWGMTHRSAIHYCLRRARFTEPFYDNYELINESCLPAHWISGLLDFKRSSVQAFRPSKFQAFKISGVQDFRRSGLSALSLIMAFARFSENWKFSVEGEKSNSRNAIFACRFFFF